MSAIHSAGILVLVHAALRLAAMALHAVTGAGRDNSAGRRRETAATADEEGSTMQGLVAGFYRAEGSPDLTALAAAVHASLSTLPHRASSSWKVTTIGVCGGVEVLVVMPVASLTVTAFEDLVEVLAREHDLRPLIEVELEDAVGRVHDAVHRDGTARVR